MEQLPVYDPSVNAPTDLYEMLPFAPLHNYRRALPPCLLVLSDQATKSQWSVQQIAAR
jgi:hypothetical protein